VDPWTCLPSDVRARPPGTGHTTWTVRLRSPDLGTWFTMLPIVVAEAKNLTRGVSTVASCPIPESDFPTFVFSPCWARNSLLGPPHATLASCYAGCPLLAALAITC
jgi:hypothetical protein